jgi:hypothetical protein
MIMAIPFNPALEIPRIIEAIIASIQEVTETSAIADMIIFGGW